MHVRPPSHAAQARERPDSFRTKLGGQPVTAHHWRPRDSEQHNSVSFGATGGRVNVDFGKHIPCRLSMSKNGRRSKALLRKNMLTGLLDCWRLLYEALNAAAAGRASRLLQGLLSTAR